MKQEKQNTELRQKLEEERRQFEKEREELKALKANSNQSSQPVAASSSDAAFRAVEQLKAELRAKEEKELERKYHEHERKLDEQISKVIKDEEYDVIEKLEMQKSVKDKLVELYNKNGKPASIKEACEAVASEVAEKFNKIKDSKHLKPKVVEEEKPATKTGIVNKMAQNMPVSKPITEADRLAAAQAFLKDAKAAGKRLM